MLMFVKANARPNDEKSRVRFEAREIRNFLTEDQWFKKSRNFRHTARNKSLRMKEQAPSEKDFESPESEREAGVISG